MTHDRPNSPQPTRTEDKYLTPEEVPERYRGEVTIGTLRNWRALRIGLSFVKIGRAVLYPLHELDAWDKAHTVLCDERSLAILHERDAED
jgi:hypothetical protein